MRKWLILLFLFLPISVSALDCAPFSMDTNPDGNSRLIVYARITKVISDESMEIEVIKNYSEHSVSRIITIKNTPDLRNWGDAYAEGLTYLFSIQENKMYLGLCSSVLLIDEKIPILVLDGEELREVPLSDLSHLEMPILDQEEGPVDEVIIHTWKELIFYGSLILVLIASTIFLLNYFNHRKA